ncbi:hypothetical protein D3C71_1826430 [compost metagenome]
MVLQVFSDAFDLFHRLDAGLGEYVAAANAGELQHMRRADRTGGEDGLATGMCGLCDAVMLEFDALHFAGLDDQFSHMRLGQDVEVRAFHRRAQKGFRCVPADA